MNIRTASFRDLGRVEQLYRETLVSDERPDQLGVDSPVPQATLLRLWYGLSKTLSSLVPLADSGDVLYVAEDPQDGIVGFVQAEVVPGKTKSWQIVNLCSASTGRGHFASERLLVHLCNRALEHGVLRLQVRLPLDHMLVPRFLEQGFTQFATEQILYSDDGSSAVPDDHPPDLLRPARRDDVGSLYLLYLRNTPSHVTSLEGPSLKAWQSSFGLGMVARLGRDDVRHLVAEQSALVAWAAIRPASATRPTLISLMCDGHDADIREKFIDAALAQLPAGPVSSVLRHYDSELIRALQRRGFAIYGTQILLIRDLAARVRVRLPAKPRKKPVLVHAGVTQSGPPVVRTPLRVLTRRSDRSEPSSRP